MLPRNGRYPQRALGLVPEESPKVRCTSSPKHPPDTLLCHYCIGIRLDGLPVQRAAGPRWTAHTLAGSGLTRRSQAPCARPPSCLGRHSSNSLLPHHWWPAAAAYNLARAACHACRHTPVHRCAMVPHRPRQPGLVLRIAIRTFASADAQPDRR